MSRQHRLQQHLRQLAEIREIMNSMKNLAFMESHKLPRYLDCQRQVTRNIDAVAADFIHFHPTELPQVTQAQDVCLLIGSERGFCGDFNESLLNQAEAGIISAQMETPRLIVVGHKLGAKLQNDNRLAAFIDGPGVTDEVASVLHQVALAVEVLRKQYSIINLSVYFFDSGTNQVSVRDVLPPFQNLSLKASTLTSPPLLNLEPQVFMAELVEHYVFATLHEIFYTSLMAENQQRIQHMESAIRHIDDKFAALSRKSHLVRQEEITEEIEVILLTAESRSRPGCNCSDPSH